MSSTGQKEFFFPLPKRKEYQMGFAVRTSKLLLFLALVLLFFHCSDTEGIKERYQAERMFYKANKLYQSIKMTPSSAGSSAYREARGAFRRLLRAYPIATLQAEGRFSEQVHRELMALIGASRMNLADLFLQEGLVDSAIAQYQKVVADHASDRELTVGAQYAIGLSYQSLGKWEQAVSAFEILLRDYPPFLETPEQPNMSILQLPVYIAQTYQMRGEDAGGQYERAREYLSGVIEKWPNSASARIARNQIANTYVSQERWQEAISTLRLLVAAHPDSAEPPEASFTIAALYSEKLQDLDKALEIYADMAKEYPKSKKLSRAHLAMAQIYLQRGEVAKSQEEFKRVIAEFPQDAVAGASAQYSLALVYEMEGEWDKALNEFHWTMENYPASLEALQVPIHILDHYLQFEEQDLASNAYSQALRDYAQFIRKNPDSPRATYGQWYIAQCHIKMKNWEKAVAALENLVADYPKSPQAPISLLRMGEIYEAQLGQPDQARRAYQRLVEKYPRGQLSQVVLQRLEKLRGELE